MHICLFITDNDLDSHIVKFCIMQKKFKFEFYNFSKIKNFKDQNKLFIIRDYFSNTDLNNFLKKYSSFISKNSSLLLPTKFAKYDYKSYNLIYYPLNIQNFENSLIKFFQPTNSFFENLVLKNNNILYNKINKKHTHLTEIESKIILLLFKKTNVQKSTLNTKVLNQSPLIDSKSLESHLYRLRKKLLKVDETKKIIYDSKTGISII